MQLKEKMADAITRLYDSRSHGIVLDTSIQDQILTFTLFRGKFSLRASHSIPDKTYRLDIANNNWGIRGVPLRGIPREYHDDGVIAAATFDHIVHLQCGFSNDILQNYIINALRARAMNGHVIWPYTFGHAGIGYQMKSPNCKIRATYDGAVYDASIRADHIAAPMPRNLKDKNGPMARRMFEAMHEMYGKKSHVK